MSNDILTILEEKFHQIKTETQIIITDKSISLPHKSYSSNSLVLKRQHAAETLEGLIKTQSLDPTARLSDSVGLGSGPENLHFKQVPR